MSSTGSRNSRSMARSRYERRRVAEVSPRPDHARPVDVDLTVARSPGGRATDGSALRSPAPHDGLRRADAIRLGHHGSRAGSDRPTILGLRQRQRQWSRSIPTSDSPWTRMRGRRDVLKLGAGDRRWRGAASLARRVRRRRAAASAASVVRSRDRRGSSAQVLSGPSRSCARGGDPSTEPALHEGLRRLQGSASRHRVGHPDAPGRRPRMGPARARSVGRPGEPVGLVLIDGQQRSRLGARRPAGGPRRRPRDG